MDKKCIQIGERYNYLECLEFVGRNKHQKKIFKFRCHSCGNEKILIGTEVKNGYTKSCGCISRIAARDRLSKHGMAGTKVYRAWKGMRQRCTNPNYEHYDRYGGRGISYSPDWERFENFYRDMGEPPGDNYQLDRIDNNGNYCKENCHWATPKENCNNRAIYSNKTGFTGVSENSSKKGRYSAYFCVNRKHVQVGTFESPEEAYKARVQAIKEYNKKHGANLKFIEFENYQPKI